MNKYLSIMALSLIISINIVSSPILVSAITNGDNIKAINLINSSKDKLDLNSGLFAAASEGNLEVFEKLLESGVDVNAVNASKKTPLMLAAENKDKGFGLAIISGLIKAGANVNAKDSNGNTALILATIKNNTDAIELLLKEAKGIDVDIKNNNGNTALKVAQNMCYHNKENNTLSDIYCSIAIMIKKASKAYQPINSWVKGKAGRNT